MSPWSRLRGALVKYANPVVEKAVLNLVLRVDRAVGVGEEAERGVRSMRGKERRAEGDGLDILRTSSPSYSRARYTERKKHGSDSAMLSQEKKVIVKQHTLNTKFAD